MISNIKITIIIVTYNCVNVISQAIESVITQTYKNIEFIIIDGNSTDGTKEVIKRYEDKISFWLSEDDTGIYEAMNKGINYATGDYIYFLGADDSLVDDYIIDEVVNKYFVNDNTIELLIGKVWMVNEKLNLQKESGNHFPIKEILIGKMVAHQGLFAKIDVMKAFLFNSKYQLAADFDFMVKCVNNNIKIRFIEDKIAFYSIFGESSLQIKKCLNEYLDILKSNQVSEANVEKFLVRNKKQLNGIKKKRKFLDWFFCKINCIQMLYLYRGWNLHSCKNVKCRWCKRITENKGE